MTTDKNKKSSPKTESSKKTEKTKTALSAKTLSFLGGAIIVAVLIGLYFSPLNGRIKSYVTTLLSSDETSYASSATKTKDETSQDKTDIEPIKKTVTVDKTPKKQPLKTENLNTIKDELSQEVNQLKQFAQQTSIYSFVVNNLMFQLTESDPLDIPEDMTNLLPTHLKYSINKIFLDSGVNSGDTALTVFQLNDELQKNFVSWANMDKDFTAKKYFDQFWTNVKSWVKVKKVVAKTSPESTKGKSVKEQLTEIQKNLMKYNLQNVNSIFKELPDVVQKDMKIWHNNLIMREKFFQLKKDLNRTMLDFFKTDLDQMQKKIILEFDIQPEKKSEQPTRCSD